MAAKSDRRELILTALIAVVALFGGFVSGWVRADEIPSACQRYRGDLIRAARLVWGLDAPVATLGAQMQQESGCNPQAVSRVGARGLAQFMPSTADWIGGIDAELAEPAPENPIWAMRALATYDRWLWDRVQADTGCDRMAMVLSSYNGGLGWLLKDKALAKRAGDSPSRWWAHVERHNAGRTAAAWRENRGYPVRILHVLEPHFDRWGGRSCT